MTVFKPIQPLPPINDKQLQYLTMEHLPPKATQLSRAAIPLTISTQSRPSTTSPLVPQPVPAMPTGTPSSVVQRHFEQNLADNPSIVRVSRRRPMHTVNLTLPVAQTHFEVLAKLREGDSPFSKEDTTKLLQLQLLLEAHNKPEPACCCSTPSCCSCCSLPCCLMGVAAVSKAVEPIINYFFPDNKSTTEIVTGGVSATSTLGVIAINKRRSDRAVQKEKENARISANLDAHFETLVEHNKSYCVDFAKRYARVQPQKQKNVATPSNEVTAVNLREMAQGVSVRTTLILKEMQARSVPPLYTERMMTDLGYATSLVLPSEDVDRFLNNPFLPHFVVAYNVSKSVQCFYDLYSAAHNGQLPTNIPISRSEDHKIDIPAGGDRKDLGKVASTPSSNTLPNAADAELSPPPTARQSSGEKRYSTLTLRVKVAARPNVTATTFSEPPQST